MIKVKFYILEENIWIQFHWFSTPNRQQSGAVIKRWAGELCGFDGEDFEEKWPRYTSNAVSKLVNARFADADMRHRPSANNLSNLSPQYSISSSRLYHITEVKSWYILSKSCFILFMFTPTGVIRAEHTDVYISYFRLFHVFPFSLV